MLIDKIEAKQIKNSRKEPTIQVSLYSKKLKATASAPSGASVGKKEVIAFPKGISYAVNKLNKLKNLEIKKFEDLKKIEKLLDVNSIGANPVIAFEFAAIKLLAKEKNLPLFKYLNPKSKKLPMPVGNVIGGGAHFRHLSTDIQEFLLIPNEKSFSKAAKINATIHKLVNKQLKTNKQTDEGAWAPNKSNIEILNILLKLARKYKIRLGIDVAATQFYKKGFYLYKNFMLGGKRKALSSKNQITFINLLIKKYNLFYVEDPLEENDFKGFSKINKKNLVVGDDLVVTNIKLLKKAIKSKSVNAIIIKPNQIGSLIKTKEIVDYANKYKIKTIISHRSGETTDVTISHLAVAWEVPFIKCGINGKEREVKLNELKKIEKII